MDTAAKPKTCVVISSAHTSHPKSGAKLRVSAVIKILTKLEFEIETLTKNELRFIEKSKRYDLGVLVSFAQLPGYFKLKAISSQIWLDSTDTLLGTRLLGLGRFKFFSYLKGVFEVLLALLLQDKFLCVTYISKRDMRIDRALFRKTPKYIFPNSRIKQDSQSTSFDKTKIYFVGDISYNANRKAIKFIESQLKRTRLVNGNEIVIVSNMGNNDRQFTYQNGNKLIYQSDVPSNELYAKNSVHIVPIWNAVGIKNKIVEPASLGLRVLAAAPSFNGLILYDHMIPVIKKSDFFPCLNKMLGEDMRAHESRVSTIETDQTLELIEFLSYRLI